MVVRFGIWRGYFSKHTQMYRSGGDDDFTARTYRYVCSSRIQPISEKNTIRAPPNSFVNSIIILYRSAQVRSQSAAVVRAES